MKTIVQIFVATLCLAIVGQAYLQAYGTQKDMLSPVNFIENIEITF